VRLVSISEILVVPLPSYYQPGQLPALQMVITRTHSVCPQTKCICKTSLN